MLLENMIKFCDDLTPIEMKVINYILNNKEIVKEQTIQELADTVFVSKSTIHRLCKKIGIDGFNKLKIQLVQDLMIKQENSKVVDVNYPFKYNDSQKNIAYKLMNLYETTIKDTFNYIDHVILTKVTHLLFNAKVIDIYTHAHNLNAAENFQDKMLTIGRIVNCPKSLYEQRMRVLAADKKHVAIIISYSGKATFIPSIIKKLYLNQIPIIFISKANGYMYTNYIKYQLSISDKENLRDRISQFSSHIALQYILDVLFSCIYNLNREKNIEYIHEFINFMDDREIE